MRRPRSKIGLESAPRGQRPRRMSPAARLEVLTEAALQVFARDGLGAARHARVAETAGVALATVFHYFPTRTALVDSVLAEVDRRYISGLVRAAAEQDAPAPEAILNLLMSFADSIDEAPEHALIWLEWSTAVRAEVWSAYLAFHQRATAGIAAIVQGGIERDEVKASLDPMDVAHIVVGLAHPIAHMKFSGSSRETIEHAMNALVGQYLRPAAA
ncbi:TetR/AcrR family transcriptional regulator [soil metagenome]